MTNGYMTSDQIADHLYISGWYTVGDGIAKDLGRPIYVMHLIKTRSRRLYLIYWYRFMWNGKLTYNKRGAK